MVATIAKCKNWKLAKIKIFFQFLDSLIHSKNYGEIRLKNDANALFVESNLAKKTDSRNLYIFNNNYTVIQICILYILIQICHKSDEISNTRT